MLITCPSCASEYVIDPAHLRPTGRTVRCASCKATFFAEAEPETDELIYDAPPQEALPAEPGLGGQDDVDAAFAMAGGFDDRDPEEGDDAGAERDLVVDAQSRRTRPSAAAARTALRERGAHLLGGLGRRLASAPVLALLAVALLVGAILARESVVRAVPDTAGLYRIVGLEVNLRGVAIGEVVSRRFEENGERVLEVEGMLTNVAGGRRDVPPLAISLRDETHTALYSWTIEPPRGDLAPGETTPFRARLVAPPAEARQVLVRFAPASGATMAGASP
ncbi:zinc-ribbon domain-containing protein [Salinarimonas chemoclinalis]|uniref:zinc-ribbon domain-containing protein n=1 Tax=Salinarimonas chemoclinalis TaxID=3241599 RepID=UPI003556B4A4